MKLLSTAIKYGQASPSVKMPGHFGTPMQSGQAQQLAAWFIFSSLSSET